MNRILTLAAAGMLGAGLVALPASAGPLVPATGVTSHSLIERAQLAEKADRAMRQGLKTLQRNSDRRAPSGDGTVRHPRAPAENARTNHQTGGPRPAQR